MHNCVYHILCVASSSWKKFVLSTIMGCNNCLYSLWCIAGFSCQCSCSYLAHLSTEKYMELYNIWPKFEDGLEFQVNDPFPSETVDGIYDFMLLAIAYVILRIWSFVPVAQGWSIYTAYVRCSGVHEGMQ